MSSSDAASASRHSSRAPDIPPSTVDRLSAALADRDRLAVLHYEHGYDAGAV
jgi:hypothetical protein